METSNSRTRQVVLRRVRTIRLIRPLLSGTVLGGAVAAASLYALGREVWVAHVIENMPSPANLLAFVRFLEAAFLNTSFVVQVLSVLLVAGMVWVVRDALQYVRTSFRYV
jgi:hypothetical protein|tara:strand:+ start:537456 stop:537785 length:330 start_codon:yes stop_codon:yes gene_type:complete